MRILSTLWLAILLVAAGAASPAQEQKEAEGSSNAIFATEFEKLRQSDQIEYSMESIKILAQVSWEHRMTLQAVSGMGGGSVNMMGNPFYADTEEAYGKFLPDLDAARDKVGLNLQLTLYRNLARWRLGELERLAPERARRKSEFDSRLAAAQTPAQVQQVVRDYQGERYAVSAKQKLEDLLIASIRQDFSWVTVVMPEVQVVDGKAPIRLTFRAVRSDGPGFVMTEYPSDGPLPVIGFGGKKEDVYGDGSVHRYQGETTFSAGQASYKIVGDKDDSLAFLLLKGKGYVYLHGKGAVVFPDGTEKKFEGAAIPPPPKAPKAPAAAAPVSRAPAAPKLAPKKTTAGPGAKTN
jgi:hypothetical protein